MPMSLELQMRKTMWLFFPNLMEPCRGLYLQVAVQ